MLSSVWVSCGYYFIDSFEKILSNFRYSLPSNLHAKQRKIKTPVVRKALLIFQHYFHDVRSSRKTNKPSGQTFDTFRFHQNTCHLHLNTVNILTTPLRNNVNISCRVLSNDILDRTVKARYPTYNYKKTLSPSI